MYDAGKIIPGLLIFLGLVTFPIWYGLAKGQDARPPTIEKPTNSDRCVEETAFMRKEHMQLVVNWRDEVVRDGQRVYVSTDGRQFSKSLTGSCLGCHTDKSASCDRCHNYLSVRPYCWECHVVPEGDL